MTDKAISPLRQRMIEAMTVRGFTPATQRGYLRTVADFTAFFGWASYLAKLTTGLGTAYKREAGGRRYWYWQPATEPNMANAPRRNTSGQTARRHKSDCGRFLTAPLVGGSVPTWFVPCALRDFPILMH